ncbi:MAG: hypothetical protein M3253_01130 [Chloroflexota bacterium]|nr:hypothetical protein [Chloroflexota bacterium]
MTFFPWLVLLLLMALVAELLIVGPRAIRLLLRGEPVQVRPASARAVLALIVLQLVLVVVWAVFFGPDRGA